MVLKIQYCVVSDIVRMLLLVNVLPLVLLPVTSAIIRRSGREPVCADISCKNNGTLEEMTCTCTCQRPFTGLFCEEEIKPSSWPMGSYSLISTIFGCPESDGYGWKKGHINMSTPVQSLSQKWKVPRPALSQHTPDPHIMGPYHLFTLQLNFCTRMAHENESDVYSSSEGFNLSATVGGSRDVITSWPQGSYCLIQAGGACPEGFSNGSTVLGGYTTPITGIGGELPYDVVSDNGTVDLRYCCRSDGNSSSHVTLPDSYPFMLLKIADEECQQVFNMTATEERFEFLSSSDWENHGDYNLFKRVNDHHLSLGLCYYKIAERECYFESDWGRSYTGSQNSSISGLPCLNWLDVDAERYGKTHRLVGDFTKNFCRRSDEYLYSVPVCYVVIDDVRTVEPCPVPTCDEDPTLHIFGVHKPAYSTNQRTDHYPEFAVDNLPIGGSFVSERPCQKPWIQVDLEQFIEVHAVIVTRQNRWFPNAFRFVGVHISKLQWDFFNYGATQCEEKRYPRLAPKYRFTCHRPIIGQYVTIRNVDDPDPHYLYGNLFPLTIKEIQVFGKVARCGRRIGMVSGEIRDFQLSGSSRTNVNSYDQGRLLLPGAGWCAELSDSHPYFQIDLIAPMVVQGLELQGWNEDKEEKRVQTFTVQFGIDETNLTSYKEDKIYDRVFGIDVEQPADMISRFIFQREFVARYIRINIKEYVGGPCLKMEIIGCPKRITRDLTCSSPSIDYGFELLYRACFWVEMPEYASIFTDDLEECIDTCNENNCLQTQFKCPACTMVTLTRYHHAFIQSFVQRPQNTMSLSITRLCITDISTLDDCDRTINKPEVLKSPSHPFYYGHVTKCTWSVDFPNDTFIRVEIVELDIAAPDTQISLENDGVTVIKPGSCSDHLQIGDTVIDESTQNQYIGSILVSTGSSMQISLHTCLRYSRTESKGFILNISYSDLPGCGSSSGASTVYCREPAGLLISPGFPAKASPLDKRWTIGGILGQYVILSFIEIDIWNEDSGTSHPCPSNFVIVQDFALNGQNTEIGRYCAANNPRTDIKSSWQNLELRYIIEESNVGTGFIAKYRIINYAIDTFTDLHEDCPDGWTAYHDHCYRPYQDVSGVTWVESEQRCQSLGGHLVSIDTEQEMTLIHGLLSNASYLISLLEQENSQETIDVYIGLKFLGSRGVYTDMVWSDGKPVTFTSWFHDDVRETQPDGGDNERCSVLRLYSIRSTQNWHDVACSYDKIYNYICETDANTSLNATNKELVDSEEDLLFDTVPSLFNCSNGEVILAAFTCDGTNDCSDGSDEYCDVSCGPNSFMCLDGSCISLSRLCNFRRDCEDGDDENDCVHPDCNVNEWRCSNGQCIPENQRCDVKHDCEDLSDETDCGACASQSFQCYDQRCIPKSRVCDGFIDCYGKLHEDENRCTSGSEKTCADSLSQAKFKDGIYLIHLGTKSVMNAECKFIKHDRSDSVETIVHHTKESPITATLTTESNTIQFTYGATTQHIQALLNQAKCKQRLEIDCLFYGAYIIWIGGQTLTRTANTDQTDSCSCPYVNKCDVDRCLCSNTQVDWYESGAHDWKTDSGYITDHHKLPIKSVEFTTLTTNQKLRITVGPLVCEEDFEITSSSLSEQFYCFQGESISPSLICLLSFDVYGEINGCRDMSHLQNCSEFECPNNHAKCPDSYCIASHLVCDGVPHCLQLEDELNCGPSRDCMNKFRCHRTSICLPLDMVCDGVRHCPEGDDELMCNITCPFNCTCHALSLSCIGHSNVHNVLDLNMSSPLRKIDLSYSPLDLDFVVFEVFYYLIELILSHCGIRHIHTSMFSNLPNLIHLDISYNEIHSLSAGAFYALSRLNTINLIGNPIEIIEPGTFTNLSGIQKLDLSGLNLQSISPGVFRGLSNLETLNISLNQIASVEDGSFKGLSKLTQLDLQRNKIITFGKGIFNYLDTLNELFTDKFTLCCVRPSNVLEQNCFAPADEFSSCSDLMREDVLRAFLWIIGVLAFLGNILVLFIRLYVQRSLMGVTHRIFITNLCFADLMMGMYLIIIAVADTAFRGQYAWREYQWRHSSVCNVAGILATVASEGSVIFLFMITIDRLLVVKFPLGKFRISQRMAAITCAISWAVLFMIALIPLGFPSYFKNTYYSRSAVCLALPLTSDHTPGWEYSVAVYIVFNFATFILIAIAQGVIYHAIVTSSSKIRTTKRRQDVTVARNLFVIVFTNFMCLFPIGIMGIMALNGHVVSGDVYAWVAVFVLPINSALNPFLYTLGPTITKQSEKVRRSLSVSSAKGKDQRAASLAQLFHSGVIFLGFRQPRRTTLDDVLPTRSLRAKEAAVIALRIIKGLKELHEAELVHGNLTTKSVLVQFKKNVLTGVALRSSPDFGLEEEKFIRDILDFGNVLKAITQTFKQTLDLKRQRAVSMKC